MKIRILETFYSPPFILQYLASPYLEFSDGTGSDIKNANLKLI